MNRDRFKFRVWDKTIKKMHYKGFLVHAEHGYPTLCDYDEWSEYHDAELMQCTGLKDKRHNLIYESDVVGAPVPNLAEWGVVTWSCGSWVIKSGLMELRLGDVNSVDLEILGNIYENPELMEGAK